MLSSCAWLTTGPTSVLGSSPSPNRSDFARATSRSVRPLRAPRCVMRRVQGVSGAPFFPAAACDDVEHPRREAGIVEDLRKAHAHEGRVGGGFEDDGVAAQQ